MQTLDGAMMRIRVGSKFYWSRSINGCIFSVFDENLRSDRVVYGLRKNSDMPPSSTNFIATVTKCALYAGHHFSRK